MTDGPQPHWIVEAALGSWIAATGWVTRRFIGQVDKHGKKLEEIEKTVVTREELEDYIQRAQNERREMHLENKETFRELRDSIDRMRSDLLDIVRATK